MQISFYLIQLLNGIQLGFLLFLVASGMTLIFGIMGIINLAHGSFYMIGAYLAYWFHSLTGNLFLAILISLPIVIIIGYLVERLTITRLYQRDHLYQILLTYGLILIFNALQLLIWGKGYHGIDVPKILSGSIPLTDNQVYPVYRLFISVVCIVIALLMYFVIQKTRFGMMIRAGANNREMVQALGIDIKKLYALVFSLGVALAGLAGMLAYPIDAVYPGMDQNILIISFVVIVVGGIGSIKGALAGAMLIGIVDSFGTVFFPQFSSFMVYLLMALVLFWKPEGLFAHPT